MTWSRADRLDCEVKASCLEVSKLALATAFGIRAQRRTRGTCHISLEPHHSSHSGVFTDPLFPRVGYRDGTWYWTFVNQ